VKAKRHAGSILASGDCLASGHSYRMHNVLNGCGDSYGLGGGGGYGINTPIMYGETGCGAGTGRGSGLQAVHEEWVADDSTLHGSCDGSGDSY